MGRRGRVRRRRKEKAINVSCSPEVISLCQWLSGQGWLPCQPLSPAVFPDTGRGLQARAHIAPGEVIISVPSSALVTATTVRKSSLGKQIEAINCDNLTAQELLSLWLVSEKNKGTSSSYFPYLQSLPTSYTVPYFCSPSERSSLPDYLSQLTENQIQTVNNAFNKVIKLKNDIATLSKLDIASFSWAWFTVNTRAVFHQQKDQDLVSQSSNSSECIALAPYLDLFNHHPDVSVDAGEGLDVRVGKEGDYQIITKNAIKKYEQVFINYGPHSNTKLYLEYGFFPPQNPHESFPISSADLCSYCRLRSPPPLHLEEKMSLLSSQKLSHNVNISSDGLSWNGKACLQVLLMSKLELKNWFTVYDTAESESINEEARMFVKFVYNKIKLNQIQSEDKVTPSFVLAKQLVLSHQSLLYLTLQKLS